MEIPVFGEKFRKDSKKGIVFIIFFFLVLFYFSNIFLLKTHRMGESDDYMLPSISLEQHFSDDIRDSDLKIALKQYPEHIGEWKRWLSGHASKKINNKSYTFYFPTYSILCLPFVWLLRVFKLSQSYGFPLANGVYYLLGLMSILKLPISFYLRIITILILGFSPLISYIRWPSAEVVIASLLIYALVFLFSHKYKLSMFFYSLAATINIVIAPFCLFIYIYVFLNAFNGKLNLKNIIEYFNKYKFFYFKLLLINLIVLIPIALNLYRFHMIASMENLGSLDGIGGRLWAYLSDLNMGIFPYFPFLLVILILTGIFNVRKLQYILFLLISFIPLFGFSLMAHIAGGMSGIARYNSWYVTLIFLGTIFYCNFVHQRLIRYINNILLLASFIWVIAVVGSYGNLHFENQNFHCWYFQPLAKYVIERWPQLYDPYPVIFASKANVMEGGYYVRQFAEGNFGFPVIYKNKDGFLVKILSSPKFLPLFYNNISMDEDYRSKFEKEIIKIEKSGKSGYLNFPPSAHAKLCNYFSFGTTGANNNLLKEGFGKPEMFGVKSTGKECELILPVEKLDARELTLIAEPFSSFRKKEKLNVTVIVDNKFSKHFTLGEPGFQKMTMPIETHGKDVEVKINIENPKSPKELGLSGDSRLLGIFLHAASLH